MADILPTGRTRLRSSTTAPPTRRLGDFGPVNGTKPSRDDCRESNRHTLVQNAAPECSRIRSARDARQSTGERCAPQHLECHKNDGDRRDRREKVLHGLVLLSPFVRSCTSTGKSSSKCPLTSKPIPILYRKRLVQSRNPLRTGRHVPRSFWVSNLLDDARLRKCIS